MKLFPLHENSLYYILYNSCHPHFLLSTYLDYSLDLQFVLPWGQFSFPWEENSSAYNSSSNIQIKCKNYNDKPFMT